MKRPVYIIFVKCINKLVFLEQIESFLLPSNQIIYYYIKECVLKY